MDILRQCRKWREEGDYRKITEALENIQRRTRDEDMRLAQAYIDMAEKEPPDRDLAEKALRLLAPLEEEHRGEFLWNFLMGGAYWLLEQAGRSLPYYYNALDYLPREALTPGNPVKKMMDMTENEASLPNFRKTFRVRTEEAWEEFGRCEGELRRFLDELGVDVQEEKITEMTDICRRALHRAFFDISFDLGNNKGNENGKYELVLIPDRDNEKLAELSYFQKHAPENVTDRWDVLVGHKSNPNMALRTGNLDISGKEVQVWVKTKGIGTFYLSFWSEKLPPRLGRNDRLRENIVYTLADQILGEIPRMRCVKGYEVLDRPLKGPYVTLDRLPEKLAEMGADLSPDPRDLLEKYSVYKRKPDKDQDSDWRMDVRSGSTCCPVTVECYNEDDDLVVDDLEADGAVAGFIIFPLDTLKEKRRIADFRHRLEDALTAEGGEDIITLTGHATGLYCGYVDFIAWDLNTVIGRAMDFFDGAEVPWGAFHTFRRNANTVLLQEERDEGDPEA